MTTVPAPPGARLVCVALSPSIDVTYVVPQLLPGTVHRPREVYRVPGGKGFNVARAAHALGAGVVATGVLGGDSGAWMVSMLARTGVRLAAVPGVHPTRSCVSVVDRGRGNLTKFYEPPAPLTAKAWSDLLTTVVRLCKGHPSWVAVSGSVPPGPLPESLADLIAAARDAGARIAVDTHSTALAAAVGAGADLVKVNVQEAAALLDGERTAGEEDPGPGTEPGTTVAADPAELARRLLAVSSATRLAVVTAGSDGAAAAMREGPAVRATLDTRGDYAVGSGDSFLGGLLAALASDPEDEAAALRLAMGAGVANALTPGAGVFDPSAARRLAVQVRLDPV